MVDRDELDRALDKGALEELPPNIPPGWLGEVAPNLTKVDDFKPKGTNAGLTDENTWQTRWLLVVALTAMWFTAPIALWLVWRSRHNSLAVKVIWTVIVLGYGALIAVATHLIPLG
jgi:hypothetical protein